MDLPYGTLDFSLGVAREEAIDYEAVFADLEAGILALNEAPAEDILAFPLLSDDEARSIVEYRSRTGPFGEREELARKGLLDPEKLEAIRAYLTLARMDAFAGLRAASRSRALLKSSEDAGGFEDTSFEALKLYHRTTVWAGERVQAAFLLDKDQGEQSAWDFAAGYVDLRGMLGLDRIVVGDYRPGFGQGVVFGRYAGIGTSPAKQRPGKHIGYRSASENGALRGAFLSRDLEPIQLTLLYSRAGRDARINSEGTVETLMESGLHVSDSEKAAQDALSETTVAGRVVWSVAPEAKIGATVATHRFDPALGPSDQEAKHYAFRGARQTLVGLDWDVLGRSLNGFGEVAGSSKGDWGLVAGIVSPIKPMGLRVVGRMYTPGFYAPYGTAFCAKENVNERGVYGELEWRLGPRARVALFLDQYRRPWRTTRIPVPTVGSDFGARIRYRATPRVTARLKLGSRHGQEAASEETLLDKQTQGVQFDVRWQATPRLTFLGGAAENRVGFEPSGESESGALAFADLHLAATERLSLDARLTVFDTDSYASRMYVFEDDLEGIFSSRAVYDRGARWYVLVKQKVGDWRLSARYSREERTTRDDVAMNENKVIRSEIGIQIDVEP